VVKTAGFRRGLAEPIRHSLPKGRSCVAAGLRYSSECQRLSTWGSWRTPRIKLWRSSIQIYPSHRQWFVPPRLCFTTGLPRSSDWLSSSVMASWPLAMFGLETHPGYRSYDLHEAEVTGHDIHAPLLCISACTQRGLCAVLR